MCDKGVRMCAGGVQLKSNKTAMNRERVRIVVRRNDGNSNAGFKGAGAQGRAERMRNGGGKLGKRRGLPWRCELTQVTALTCLNAFLSEGGCKAGSPKRQVPRRGWQDGDGSYVVAVGQERGQEKGTEGQFGATLV